MKTDIVILAAGSASCMGSIKQLLPYAKSTLLEHTISNAIKSKARNVYCVIGANAKLIKREIDFLVLELLIILVSKRG